MNRYLLIALTYDATLLAICTFALVRGGRPERIGAAVNLIASIASSAARLLHLSSWAPAQFVMLAIDGSVTAAFFVLAISTTRFWPIWAFGFALADIFVSVAGALLPHAPWLAYQSGLTIYAYLALAALAVGAWRVPRRPDPEQRRGHRPPWTMPKRT